VQSTRQSGLREGEPLVDHQLQVRLRIGLVDKLLVYLGIRVEHMSAGILGFLARHPYPTTIAVTILATIGMLLTVRQAVSIARATRGKAVSAPGDQQLATAIRSHYEAYPFIEGGQNRINRWKLRLRALLPDELIRGTRVLDVGCGVGEVARSLADRGAEVTCLDLTTAATRRCQELHDSMRVVQADALALPFRDTTFDHVLAIGVLHHTQDCARGLAEMSRITRPGGRVVVLLYSRWTPYHALYLLTRRLRRRRGAEAMDSLPQWLLTMIRLVLRIQIGQKLPDPQVKRLVADQIWTPRASFHSPREVARWAQRLHLRLLVRKRIPLYSNIFVFEPEPAR
jgi:ubiquinone/menaquinone biosynthesis C-methylase UbiE